MTAVAENRTIIKDAWSIEAGQRIGAATEIEGGGGGGSSPGGPGGMDVKRVDLQFSQR